METNLSMDEQLLGMNKRDINDFLLEMSKARNDDEERYRWHRPLTPKQFAQVLTAAANNVLRTRCVYEPFVIDDLNRPIITNLYYYFTGNQEQCAWNVDKGLYFYGRIGSGKTLLMLAFLRVVNAFCHIVTEKVNAKDIFGIIKTEGIGRLLRCPLFIDELGRESLEINEYGNKIRPIQDLFAMRYESGARTFITTNFSTEQLEGKNVNGQQQGYGRYVRSRMEEMMNIIKVDGESRRHQYIIEDNGNTDKN